MNEQINLPENIKLLITGKQYQANDIGMSGAQVRVFDDCVLKIAPYQQKNEDTVSVMRWLEGRLPVPKVLCYERDPEYQYLLMTRVKGRMACDPYYLSRPQQLIPLLAEGLKMFWQVGIGDCPVH